jgi:hypothetical protein
MKSITQVIRSNEKIKVVIPKILGDEFSDILKETQQRMAKEISEKYGIDYEEILKKCIPSMPSVNYKKNNNITEQQYTTTDKNIVDNKPMNKLDVNTWKNAKSADELTTLTLIELKSILKSIELKVSGNKSVLIERLWKYIKG